MSLRFAADLKSQLGTQITKVGSWSIAEGGCGGTWPWFLIPVWLTTPCSRVDMLLSFSLYLLRPVKELRFNAPYFHLYDDSLRARGINWKRISCRFDSVRPEELFQRFRNKRRAEITPILATLTVPANCLGQHKHTTTRLSPPRRPHHAAEARNCLSVGGMPLQSTSRCQSSRVSRNYPMRSRHDSVPSIAAAQRTRLFSAWKCTCFGVIFGPFSSFFF